MGYSATGGITGTPQIDRTTNTATYSNVEVPVANAPRFGPGNPPPATAPNGSTFVADTGVTWTKRGGVWTVEARAGAPNDGMPRGYAALTPPELLAQTQANLPEGFSAGTLGPSGVEMFLRQYGIPANESQYFALAQQSGMTVDALKNYIASVRGPLRFESQRDIQVRAEEQAWKAQNNVGEIPYNYAFVPASEGGPRLRKLSYDEVVARGFQPYGGRAAYDNLANDLAAAQQTGTLGLLTRFGGLTAPTGGGTPGAAGAVDLLTGGTTPVLKQTPTTTSFAPNDPNGPWSYDKDNWLEIEPGSWIPRGPEANRWKFENGRWVSTMGTGSNVPGPFGPFPPTSGPTGGPTGTPVSGPTGGGVTGGGTPATAGGGLIPRTPIPTLPPFYTAPTAPTGAVPPATMNLSNAARDLRTKLLEQLTKLEGPSEIQGQAYEALRKAKADELAAQYGAERSRLEEELARRGLSASTIGGGRYGDLAGQQARAIAGFEAELLQQQAEADQRRQQMYFTGLSDLTKTESDIELRAAQLQQEAALRGRELDLQSARDMATSEYQRGQLGLGYAEMGSRERIAGAQLDEQKRSAEVLEGIRTGELTLSQGVQIAQILRGMYAGEIPVEAWESLLRSLGVDPTKYPRPNVTRTTTTTPTTTTTNTPTTTTTTTPTTTTPTTTNPRGPTDTTNPNTPIAITQIPNDLSGYANGQKFSYFGVTLTLLNGVLRDDTGRAYRTGE
jgi:hypothetical protein